MKKLFSALFIFLFLTSTKPVFASDMTITCDNSSCTGAVGSLFDEDNFAPGETVKKSLDVVNTTSDSCTLKSLSVKNTANNSYLEVLYTSILDNGTEYYGRYNGTVLKNKSILDLKNDSPLQLNKSVNPNTSKTIDWYVYFDEASGDKFQSASGSFDFDLSIECDAQVAESSTDNGTTNTDSGGGNQESENSGSVLGTFIENVKKLATGSIIKGSFLNSNSGKILGTSDEISTSESFACTKNCCVLALIFFLLFLTMIFLYFRQKRLHNK